MKKEETKKLQVSVEKIFFAEFKGTAAMQDKTMTAAIIEAMRLWIDKQYEKE